MGAKLTVIANLVVSSFGATSKNGSSVGLSSPNDRKRFHELRTTADAILIGGETARREPYKKTPIPLFIITHSLIRLQPKNPLARQLNLDPAAALFEISNYFTDKESAIILVEAGPKLLLTMIEKGLIDRLFLTVNHEVDGENKIDLINLVRNFELLSSEKIDNDEFKQYQLIQKN
jgi:riboflavin biosynthesis pyrimidine reductase